MKRFGCILHYTFRRSAGDVSAGYRDARHCSILSSCNHCAVAQAVTGGQPGRRPAPSRVDTSVTRLTRFSSQSMRTLAQRQVCPRAVICAPLTSLLSVAEPSAQFSPKICGFGRPIELSASLYSMVAPFCCQSTCRICLCSA